MSIDNKHIKVHGVSSWLAYMIVKFLRFPIDVFFKRRYGHRAVVIETVAAVPGMVGATFQHLKLLRRLKKGGGAWIRELLSEAENERMHLLIFMEYAQPNWFERILIIVAQGFIYNFYFFLYLCSSRTAHRLERCRYPRD